MNEQRRKRKVELEALSQDAQTQILADQESINISEAELAALTKESENLEAKHGSECRREVIEHRSDRASIELAISNTHARIKGLRLILEEKSAALAKLRRDVEPIDTELRQLQEQERYDAGLQEVADSEADGEAEVRTYLETSKSFFRRLAQLRDVTNLLLRKPALDAAERLENHWNGRR